ncbi:hypothetical protein [Nocardioides litoris]|uniref:hypothetical protein n=1 Tax=Nocardioides litoris TaxID=1926648 RepID=UPI00111E6159|nr:hypothetical protein [Nocardioides litoris]
MSVEPAPRAVVRAGLAGIVGTVALVVLAFELPGWLGFDPMARRPVEGEQSLPPLRGYLDVKPWLSEGTIRLLVVAVLAWLVLPRLLATVRWPLVLASSYAAGVAWLLALAYVDGPEGLSRVEEMPGEYLATARTITDVPMLLDTFVSRITYGEPDSWPTHVSGHPPGALLFFVLLVRLGVTTSWGVGLVVTLVAASTAPAALVALRALDAEGVARRAAPFLVLTPGAVLMAVSGDGVFAAVSAWGLALLAVAAAAWRAGRRTAVPWSVAAGLVLGLAVHMSYGLLLLGPVALAVLAAARSWRALPWAVGGALVVVVVFGLFGFWWWEAYGPLHDRYYAGLASQRPQAYWSWANLAALAVGAGPLALVGVACALPGVRATVRGAGPGEVTERRTAVLLVLSAAAAILAATLSAMSRAEVERIWLPWTPWLLLSAVLLPPRWRRTALAVQVAVAVLHQQLVFTQW